MAQLAIIYSSSLGTESAWEAEGIRPGASSIMSFDNREDFEANLNGSLTVAACPKDVSTRARGGGGAALLLLFLEGTGGCCGL